MAGPIQTAEGALPRQSRDSLQTELAQGSPDCLALARGILVGLPLSALLWAAVLLVCWL